MEQTKLCAVTVGETARAYPYGTTYQTIAADFQEQYENDILLVSRNGKLCELNKTLDRDCTLDIITAKDKPGIQTYERSAVFLMLKAFYDVAGSENVERISVEYSIGPGLFIRAKGSFVLNQSLLDQVGERMQAACNQATPFKNTLSARTTLWTCFRKIGCTTSPVCLNSGSIPMSISIL